MVIKDNFLNKKELKALQDLMLGPTFSWCYNDGVLGPNDQNRFQFTHLLFANCRVTSATYDFFLRLFQDKLHAKCFIRIKANLNPRSHKPIKQGFHTDYSNNKTAIFYLNTNNGYTEFENGKIVESVANRMVEFDSNLKHQSVTCTDNKIRVVINFNYYKMRNDEEIPS